MKKSHKKPTQKDIEKLAAEAEEMQDDPKATADEETPGEVPEEVTDEGDVEESPTDDSGEEETKEGEEVEGEAEEEPGDVEEPPKKPEKKPETDYKKRYSDSTREAQSLHKKNKKINEAIDEAGKLPDPTEEELKAEYTDWDVMSDTERKLAKDSFTSMKRFAHIHKITEEFRSMDAWANKVDAFINDPASLKDYPALEGNEKEFKTYATDRESRQGADFEDLVGSFVFSTKATVKPKKGKMFETGTGGPPSKPKPKKISFEDAALIKKNDYNKWKRLLKAGKLEQF